MEKIVTDAMLAFFKGSWSGNCRKPIRNWGGNFWGPSRTRCSIIQPEVINALVATGHAERVPGAIIFNKEVV